MCTLLAVGCVFMRKVCDWQWYNYVVVGGYEVLIMTWHAVCTYVCAYVCMYMCRRGGRSLAVLDLVYRVGPCIRTYFCSEVRICTCMFVGGMCWWGLGFGCVLVGGGGGGMCVCGLDVHTYYVCVCNIS